MGIGERGLACAGSRRCATKLGQISSLSLLNRAEDAVGLPGARDGRLWPAAVRALGVLQCGVRDPVLVLVRQGEPRLAVKVPGGINHSAFNFPNFLGAVASVRDHVQSSWATNCVAALTRLSVISSRKPRRRQQVSPTPQGARGRPPRDSTPPPFARLSNLIGATWPSPTPACRGSAAAIASTTGTDVTLRLVQYGGRASPEGGGLGQVGAVIEHSSYGMP
jgi:hypothetical protein